MNEIPLDVFCVFLIAKSLERKYFERITKQKNNPHHEGHGKIELEIVKVKQIYQNLENWKKSETKLSGKVLGDLNYCHVANSVHLSTISGGSRFLVQRSFLIRRNLFEITPIVFFGGVREKLRRG